MKQHIRGIFAMISALGIPSSAFAQVVVMAEPPPPQQEQFLAPTTPGQVWVGGHYDITQTGQYQWVPGHWEAPPQQGMVWVDPRVSRRRGQMMFFPGRWDWPDRINRRFFRQGAFGLQTQVGSYQVGTIVTGILGQTDYHNPQGGYADDYAVYLTARQQVTFLVRGGPTASGQRLDVVASIHSNGRELARDDDGAGFPDAMLRFVAPVTGVYALRISTFGSQQEAGTYTIQSWTSGAPQNPFELPPTFGLGPAIPVNPGQPIQPQPIPPQPIPPQPGPITAQPVRIGQTVQGQLTQGDAVTQEGAFADNFVINLGPNQGVALSVNTGPDNFGQQFDTVLDVFGPNGQLVAHDDDSGGNQNPRTAFVSQFPGQYRIQLRAFSAGRVGAYNMMIQPGNSGVVPPVVNPPPVVQPPGNQGPLIQVGQTIQGSLTQGDLQGPNGALADLYTLNLGPNQTVTLFVQAGPDNTGQQFDTVLNVYGANGQPLGHDDDSGGNNNPRLTFTARAPGAYTVQVLAYQPQRMGNYMLSVTPGGGVPQPMPYPQPNPQPIPQPPTTAPALPLQLGQSIQGALQPGDMVTQEGTFADNYAISLAQGQTVVFTAQGGPSNLGGTIDTVLEVLSMNGQSLGRDDDSGGNRNPRLAFTAPAPGTYFVRIRSYTQNASGSYVLTAGQGLAPAIPVQPTQPVQPVQPLPGTMMIQLGQTVQGTLQQGDQLSPDGGFADNYTVMLGAGQTITLVVRGNDGQGRSFDTALDVISPIGDTVAHDDDSGGDFNPRLSFTARVAGPYTIRVRAYWRGRTGAYQLSAFQGNLLQQ